MRLAACEISVIIPVYNIQQHLRECLDSVLGQSYPHLQVICVDDGSTDESPAILAEYAQKDPRVQVIRQQNAGPGAARNTGLEAATGEYVIFLDSDDWFEPDFLAKMVDTAQREGADVAICRAVEFDTNSGRELPSEWMMKKQYLPGKLAFAPQEMADHLFQFTYGMPWDKFYRRELLTSSGIRYPALKNSEDLAFVYPTLLAATRIAVVDQVLIHHRINRMASVLYTGIMTEICIFSMLTAPHVWLFYTPSPRRQTQDKGHTGPAGTWRSSSCSRSSWRDAPQSAAEAATGAAACVGIVSECPAGTCC